MAAGSDLHCSRPARRAGKTDAVAMQLRIAIRQADSGFVAELFDGVQGERVTRLAFSDAESAARTIRLRLLMAEKQADDARAAALKPKGRV